MADPLAQLPEAAARRCRGFTLAESLIAATTLGVAVVGIVGSLLASYQQSRESSDTEAAVSLAEQLAEEIASRPLPLPSQRVNYDGVGRAYFNDVLDYDGYSDTTATLAQAGSGSVEWHSDGVFSRRVEVRRLAAPGGEENAGGDFAIVTVRVETPGGRVISTSRLITIVKARPE